MVFTPRNPTQISSSACAGLLAAAFLVSSACEGESVSPDDASGQAAALDITLPSIDGEDVTLQAKRDTDVFVLAFWATWCEPCQAELAKFQPMWRELESRGMHLVGIATDGPDSMAGVPTIARREGYEFPVLLDRDSDVFGRYNPTGDLPFYVVLDAQGGVLKSHQGYNVGDEEELRHFMEEKLPAAE